MSEHGNEQTAEMAPPPPAAGPPPNSPPASATTAVPPTRQLVRDPYTRLGGVASGLGHYFGVDVSLVRLAFVLLVPFSGIGLVVYLLAWLVVPRAQYWPPAGTPRPLHSVSTREIGIGLAALVILMALFVNGGALARVVVPVLLVAGGVWLLRQPEDGTALSPPPPNAPPTVQPSGGATVAGVDGTDRMEVSGPFSPPDAAQPLDTVTDPFGVAPPPIPPVLPTAAPYQPAAGGPAPGTSVPARRRRLWRRLLGLFLAFLVLILIIVALVVGAIIGGFATTGFGFSATYRPETVDDIPTSIVHGAGDIELDLTEFTAMDFDGLDDEIRIDVELDVGEVRVVIPENLPVSVDAEADVGDVTVFGGHEDGIDPGVARDDDEPVIDLNVKLGAGQIAVERGDG